MYGQQPNQPPQYGNQRQPQYGNQPPQQMYQQPPPQMQQRAPQYGANPAYGQQPQYAQQYQQQAPNPYQAQPIQGQAQPMRQGYGMQPTYGQPPQQVYQQPPPQMQHRPPQQMYQQPPPQMGPPVGSQAWYKQQAGAQQGGQPQQGGQRAQGQGNPYAQQQNPYQKAPPQQSQGGAQPPQKSNQPMSGTLRVTVIGGEGFKKLDTFSANDMFCEIRCTKHQMDETHKTLTRQNSAKPQWNKSCEFSIANSSIEGDVTFTVYHKGGMMGKNKKVGEVTMRLSDLVNDHGGSFTGDLPTTSRYDRNGKVEVSLEFQKA